MENKSRRVGRIKNKLFLFVLLGVILSFSACVSHIQQLREAQNQFNMAATMENQIKLGNPRSAIVSAGEATVSYRIAVKIISDLLEKNRSELQKDRLLGNAYTIKAMAEWRLGEYDSAMKTVSTALGQLGLEIFPRDRVLLQALRGLIKNDQAFAHMMEKDYPYTDIKNLLVDSLHNLDSALATAPKGSRIRLYILLSELAVLKNWADLRGEPGTYSESLPADFDKITEINEWCNSAKPVWKNFVEECKKVPEARGSLLRDWGQRIGMPESCN